MMKSKEKRKSLPAFSDLPGLLKIINGEAAPEGKAKALTLPKVKYSKWAGKMDEMMALFEQGLSQFQVGEEIGCSSSLAYDLKRHIERGGKVLPIEERYKKCATS